MDKHARFDADDDILPYLDFSDPPPPILFSPPHHDPQQRTYHLPPPPPPPRSLLESSPGPAQDCATGCSWLNCFNSMLHGVPDFAAGDGISSSRNNNEPLFVSIKPDQLDCSYCYLLREITHSNGYQNVKVAVHGGPSYFNHAIFEIECQGEVGQKAATGVFFINLSTLSCEWVNGFLKMYIMYLDVDDSIVLKDMLHPSYALLCGGANQEAQDTDHSIVNSWLQMPEQEVRSGDPSCSRAKMNKMKTVLAVQRERAHNMKLKDLADYFHLPIADAAEKLQLCSTAIKHACRRNGVVRWPSRKEQIKSIDRQIATLERQMQSCSREGMLEKLNEIEQLRVKKERLYAGLDL